MNRSRNLSSLIITVAISVILTPLMAAAGNDTNLKLNTKTKEINKTKKINFETIKKPVAPTAPVVTAPKKSVVINKAIKTTKPPEVKSVNKPAVKTVLAQPKTNAKQKVSIAKPTNKTKIANANPVAKITVSAPSIPTNAISVWEENARQKCLSWGAQFENIGFSELQSSNSKPKELERIFANHNNAYISGDFNGDGKKDYIIITPDGGCKTGGNSNFAKIGPPNQFLLSNDKGYSIASGFNGWTNPQQIKHSGNNDIIELNDAYVGKCGQVAKTTWGWDGDKITILERRNPQGQIVNQEGCLILASTSINALQMGNSVQKPIFPPITPGFYSYSVTCSNAISESRRDRPSKFIGLFNPQVWGFFYDDGIAWNNIRLENIDLVSDNQYRLQLHYLGNANNKELTDANMKILGNDRFSITLKGYTTIYSHCPDTTIPDWLRAQFVN